MNKQNKNVDNNDDNIDAFNEKNASKFISEALDKAEECITFNIPDVNYFQSLIEKTLDIKTIEICLHKNEFSAAKRYYYSGLKDIIAFALIALTVLLIQLLVILNFTNFFVYFQIACIIIPAAAIPKIIKKRMGAA